MNAEQLRNLYYIKLLQFIIYEEFLILIVTTTRMMKNDIDVVVDIEQRF